MSRSSRALVPVFVLALFALPACDDSTEPDGLDPSDFIGTFVLDPSLQATCDLGDLGDVIVTIDTVEITDATEDSVWLRLPITADTEFGDFADDAEFALEHEAGDQEFGGVHTLDLDIPAGFTTVHADGTVALQGAFDDTDSFQAEVLSDVTLAVGDGASSECSAIDLDVTGTRVD